MDVQKEHEHIDHALERLRKTPRRQFGITEYCLYTALAILSLTNLDISLAVEWLFRKKRKGAALNNDATRVHVEDFLINIVNQSSRDMILSRGSPQNCPLLGSVRTANQYVADRGTAQRLRDANIRLGRAPSSDCVLRDTNTNRRKKDNRWRRFLFPRVSSQTSYI